MSWDFFILRYVEVLVEIYLEIKSFPEIMYDYNFTAARRMANFLYFLQMLLKDILK